MDREKHKKASQLWNAIDRKQKEILSFEKACNLYDLLWVGQRGDGVDIKGESKAIIAQIVKAGLHEQLASLEKQYEEL